MYMLAGETTKEKNIFICPDELTWRKRYSRSYNPRLQTVTRDSLSHNRIPHFNRSHSLHVKETGNLGYVRKTSLDIELKLGQINKVQWMKCRDMKNYA